MNIADIVSESLWVGRVVSLVVVVVVVINMMMEVVVVVL